MVTFRPILFRLPFFGLRILKALPADELAQALAARWHVPDRTVRKLLAGLLSEMPFRGVLTPSKLGHVLLSSERLSDTDTLALFYHALSHGWPGDDIPEAAVIRVIQVSDDLPVEFASAGDPAHIRHLACVYDSLSERVRRNVANALVQRAATAPPDLQTEISDILRMTTSERLLSDLLACEEIPLALVRALAANRMASGAVARIRSILGWTDDATTIREAIATLLVTTQLTATPAGEDTDPITSLAPDLLTLIVEACTRAERLLQKQARSARRVNGGAPDVAIEDEAIACRDTINWIARMAPLSGEDRQGLVSAILRSTAAAHAIGLHAVMETYVALASNPTSSEETIRTLLERPKNATLLTALAANPAVRGSALDQVFSAARVHRVGPALSALLARSDVPPAILARCMEESADLLMMAIEAARLRGDTEEAMNAFRELDALLTRIRRASNSSNVELARHMRMVAEHESVRRAAELWQQAASATLQVT